MHLCVLKSTDGTMLYSKFLSNISSLILPKSSHYSYSMRCSTNYYDLSLAIFGFFTITTQVSTRKSRRNISRISYRVVWTASFVKPASNTDRCFDRVQHGSLRRSSSPLQRFEPVRVKPNKATIVQTAGSSNNQRLHRALLYANIPG